MFNRAPEGAGHKFWLDTANANKLDITQLSQMMLDSKPAKEYFAGKEANADFVNHIYKNLFNKTSAEDAEGVKFWVDKLNAGNSKAFIVTEMLKAAANNTYTKPEDIKAQNLFKNKVKAAEAVSKVIADVPESGTILEKISGFNAILKNIKDTSTPTQIAQVIKQEALKGKLKISDDKTIADSLKAIFPSSDSAAIEKALNSTTVDTNIYPSIPTPPGGSGGNSGGESGGSSGGSPSPKPTPDEIKQQELDKKAKEAEENLKTKDEALKLAELEKDITYKTEDVIKNHASGDSKEKALEYVGKQIETASTPEIKAVWKTVKAEIEKLSATITPLEKEIVTGKALVAQKKVDLAKKEKAVAEDENDIANFLAKEKALDAAVANTTKALKKADFDKTVAKAIENNKGGTGINTIQDVITAAKNALATEEQKAAAEAQIKALATLLNLELSDKTTKRFVEKTKENLDKANDAQLQADNAKTAAENAKTAAENAKTAAENKIHDDKIAVIKANVVLKKTEKESAENNHAINPTPDLQKAKEDATASYNEAQEKAKVEITKLLADKFKAVILEKDGDTNVYKSADNKYIVDITGGTINDGKTLVFGKGDNKLYEIDQESDDLEANATLNNKVVLVKESDTKATTFKNGAEEINFILKDGKLQAAFKEAAGFVVSEDIEASYDNLSKAEIQVDSFTIDTPKKGHSVVLAGSKVGGIKMAAGEYALTDAEKPELASIESITEKAVGDVKFPLINGKVVNGTIGANTIFANDQNKLDAIKIDTKKYYFNSNDQVIKVKVGDADSDLVYTLKNPTDFAIAKKTPDANLKTLSNFAENNEAKFVLEGGKLMKIQVKDGAELNVKTPADFDPAQINAVKIDKVIISGKEFTLTAAAQYQDAKAYKQVEGKNLLLKGAEYINATVEEDGNKYITTDAGANKYTLTVTKADKNVYIEQLESGITKTKNFKEDGNAIKDVVFKGTEANKQDNITIDGAGATAETINKANLDKATFDSIEKLTINLDTLLTSKEFGIISEKNIGIFLGKNIKVSDTESQDAKSINLTNIKSYDHKLTLDLAQNRGVDTITIGKVLAKDKLAIVGFAADDKIDFRALGVTASTAESAIEYNSDTKGFAGNKIYNVLAGINETADQIKFADFFTEAVKPFDNGGLSVLADGTKSIISVIGNNGKTGLYLVDVKGGNGLNNDDDITLIGVLDGVLNLSDANIVS